MKRERYQNGTVYLDKRVGLWYFHSIFKQDAGNQGCRRSRIP